MWYALAVLVGVTLGAMLVTWLVHLTGLAESWWQNAFWSPVIFLGIPWFFLVLVWLGLACGLEWLWKQHIAPLICRFRRHRFRDKQSWSFSRCCVCGDWRYFVKGE